MHKNSQTDDDNYSLTERKQSLISKLRVFNQSNGLEGFREKIEATLNSDKIPETYTSRTDDKICHQQKIIEKFLAEVLKLGDLKRLLKQKFTRESDWTPKMREMHQFYTFLEYSMETFRSNLDRTVETNWKNLI